MAIDITTISSPRADATGAPPLPVLGHPHQADARRTMASSAERMVGAAGRDSVVEWIGGTTVGTDVAASAVGAGGDMVSGDWTDIIVRPHMPGCSITIGDAMGSGAAAAPSGRLLRLSARAFFDCSHHTGSMITALDRLVARWDDTIATCLTVDIDTSGHVVAHSAGHPPPVVIDDRGGARFLQVPTAGPLGLGTICAAAAHAHVGPGATIIMYTDGLIERRHLSIDDGLTWLLATSSAMPGLPVDVVAHGLLERSIDLSPAEDDITVVVARLT
jgi:serine phosphatase RsbU (regulator of sigma subunit)